MMRNIQHLGAVEDIHWVSNLANHITAMLAYWDRDLRCRYANPAYLEWFGKTQEEMVNKITLQELLGPIYELNLPYINGVLAGNRQTFEREIPFPSGLGMRHSLANYYPDVVNGVVIGFYVHVVEITQLKLLQNELKLSSERVREQNKLLLYFANIVGHNLKSYSGNLRVILDMMENTHSEKERSELFEILKDISLGFSTTVNNLNEIVEVHNNTGLLKESTNLQECISRAIDIVKVEIRLANAIIHNNIPPRLTLRTNAAYLDSIALNLITNALKYRHPDRQPVIDISAQTQQNMLVLSFKDKGLGINLDKYKNEMFNMYKTFHGNANAKGVGLFLVRTQVEALGGRIEVDSVEHQGTTFTIYLKA
jgi:signal transduction histidine kinase